MRARHRRHARQMRRFLAELERVWNERDRSVFDMDGVLVDVTESYRETIRANGATFHRHEVSHAS